MEANKGDTSRPLHPACKRCGWRMGGVDSWDGKACRCGKAAPAMAGVPAPSGPLSLTVDERRMIREAHEERWREERAANGS
jgi:hypothetical protein